MNTLYFYKSFLRKVRSHLGEPARLTGPAHLHKNSPLASKMNISPDNFWMIAYFHNPYNDSKTEKLFHLDQNTFFYKKNVYKKMSLKNPKTVRKY